MRVVAAKIRARLDGFAARCEAWALPRRLLARISWAVPLVRASPLKSGVGFIGVTCSDHQAATPYPRILPEDGLFHRALLALCGRWETPKQTGRKFSSTPLSV